MEESIDDSPFTLFDSSFGEVSNLYPSVIALFPTFFSVQELVSY